VLKYADLYRYSDGVALIGHRHNRPGADNSAFPPPHANLSERGRYKAGPTVHGGEGARPQRQHAVIRRSLKPIEYGGLPALRDCSGATTDFVLHYAVSYASAISQSLWPRSVAQNLHDVTPAHIPTNIRVAEYRCSTSGAAATLVCSAVLRRGHDLHDTLTVR